MKTQTFKGKNSDNLQRLHTLCDQLNTRDDQLKRDLRMFEDFFSNFPVPVTMWSIGKDHTMLSKWGNAFTCNEPKSLEEMFECPAMRDESIKKHELAFLGNTVSYFVQHEHQLFWCKLVPRKNAVGEILGVTGMAWDVTSNSIMIHGLEKIMDLLDANADSGAIRDEVTKALDASRLRKMLAEREELGG